MNLTPLIIGIIAFVIGNITGYLLHDFFRKSLMMSENLSKNLLVLAVTITWFISMLVSLVNPAYQVPLPVHGIMGIIVGFFFYRAKKEGNEN